MPVAHVAAHHLGVFSVAVEHLYFIHGIGGQVLQRCLRIAGKEISSIHQQALNLTSVHLDFAIAAHLRTRKLSYQRIEHRPFGQFEGVGVEHHCVAAHHHLDLCARDHHLVQQLRVRIHLQHAQVHFGLPVLLDLKRGVERLVSYRRKTQNELSFSREWNGGSPCLNHHRSIFLGNNSLDDSTVGGHQCGCVIPDRHFVLRIDDCKPYLSLRSLRPDDG